MNSSQRQAKAVWRGSTEQELRYGTHYLVLMMVVVVSMLACLGAAAACSKTMKAAKAGHCRERVIRAHGLAALLLFAGVARKKALEATEDGQRWAGGRRRQG